MKSNYGMVSAAALVIGLSGCSANKVAENVITEEVINKVVVAEPEPIINTKSVLYKTAKVKSATSQIPEWFKVLPKEDFLLLIGFIIQLQRKTKYLLLMIYFLILCL